MGLNVLTEQHIFRMLSSIYILLVIKWYDLLFSMYYTNPMASVAIFRFSTVVDITHFFLIKKVRNINRGWVWSFSLIGVFLVYFLFTRVVLLCDL